ncbi:MAG: MotE family protein [Alphaproteobacteria bacterium]
MFRGLRVLPLFVIVAFLAFSVRLSEVVVGISSISDRAYAAQEEEKTEEHHEEEMKGHGEVEAVDSHAAKAPEWRDASDSDFDLSDVKMEMFEDLMSRRAQLDKMEKDFHVREALLKAAEQELDRKYQELNTLKQEIEGLLGQQKEEEQGRIKSLVKIYEGMKPKDAARIFDTLDIDVLVSVLSKMSERKISPILAAMNPERARSVTIMLAEEKKLPVL